MRGSGVHYCRTKDGVNIAYGVLSDDTPHRGISVVTVTPPFIPMAAVMTVFQEDPAFRGMSEQVYGGMGCLAIFADVRGTGLSDADVPALDAAGFSEDLAAVIAATQTERAVLHGVGIGGAIIARYAAAHPGQIAGVVFHDAWVRGTDFLKPVQDRGILSLAEADPYTFAQTVARMMTGWRETATIDAQVETVLEAAADQAAYARLLDALASLDATTDLDAIEAPGLVVWERSGSVFYDEGKPAREIASRIADASLLITETQPDGSWSADFRESYRRLLESAFDQSARPAAMGSRAFRTILFTDLAASTATTQRLGDAAAQDIVRAHNEIVREALRTYDGHEIKHTGDGIMAWFPAASNALDCAQAIQQAVTDLANPDLGVKIGLNAGEPIAEEDDLYGTAVQIAARVTDRAAAGEIVCTNVVRELVAGKGYRFSEREPAALKGFEEPARLFEVGWESAAR